MSKEEIVDVVDVAVQFDQLDTVFKRRINQIKVEAVERTRLAERDHMITLKRIDGYTYTHIAGIVGLTPSRVRQISNSIQRRMRHMSRGKTTNE